MIGRHAALLAIAATVVAGLTPMVASGQVVTYTDRTAFVAASAPLAVETFDEFTGTNPIGSGPFPVSGAFSLLPVRSTDSIRLDSPTYNVNGTEFLYVALDTRNSLILPSSLTFTFNTAITSFGADFRNLNNGDGSNGRTFAIVGGTTINPLPPEPAFLGFISSTPFTTVTFELDRLGSDGFGIDNVTFNASAVPEPASWATMVAGMALVGMAMRRRLLPAPHRVCPTA